MAYGLAEGFRKTAVRLGGKKKRRAVVIATFGNHFTLNDALEKAEASPLPDPATLLDGVYATPEDLDTPHHK